MRNPDGPTAVLLIAHGSRHRPANDDLHNLAARVVERGDYPIVEPCFLELADPDIPTGGDRCVERGASRVLMVPYFLSEGVHLLRDLAAARGELAHRHPSVEFRLASPLGPHPLLDRLVDERIRQAESGGRYRGLTGKVVVAARVENIGDLHAADQGRLAPDEVRAVEVADAPVDTGATGLSMPRSMLETLGLKHLRTRKATTSAGPVDARVFGTARLTIQGRDCPVDITELPDGCPVLIGRIPLEAMDFVVDTPSQRLIGNPAHGAEHIIELY